ncbi:outer membrane porin, OprD family [Salinimicrobium catena]|uniref:Outer membrane porin, OprD family n=1 Tax=Salinimicrobium catena TaxID=390640 RepID=A0A1H5PB54_9FLAO|nr:OprD family outer membrane porin [Salinimicrobium catena]SDL77689.1 outer membrane porin, OprD family [Salinimicrobium catena]SEF11162.1 outer membrane porin, OprD family [Salinimicrobium catena]
MLKRNSLLLILLLPLTLLAQDSLQVDPKGKLTGQWRNYYMNTFNKEELKDFTALATGGHLKYAYRFTPQFSVTGAVHTSVNTWIQDLTIPDPITGKRSRYEEGLFNRLDLDEKFLFVAGELFARYKLKEHEWRLGRMKFVSPLVNPEDGRMIPTFVQGFHYSWKPAEKSLFEAGILNEIAPRSTGGFYSIGESIGTYGTGRNWLGEPAEYAGNTHSDFLITAHANFNLLEQLNVDFWNYYADNVFNTSYLNPEWYINEQYSLEMEWVHQERVGDGGNALEEFRYFEGNSSDVLGTRINYKWDRSSLALSYNRILPHGQFIFPREWGREFLFSFQKRERSEGSADNHALVAYYNTNIPLEEIGTNVRSILSVGHQWKPSVLDPRLNKYAVPDYTQVNLDLFFDFEKWKNLKAELLLVGKFASSHFPDNPNFYLNKTDLFHIDLILNYNF